MRYYLCLLSILCLPITVYAGEIRTTGKPRSPLQVSISPVQQGLLSEDIKPGDVVELRVAASSRIDSQRMDIEVDLSGGAELLAGETKWSGPVMKGVERALALSVRAPLKGNGKISARASILLSETTGYSASASYTLGKELEVKSKVSPPVRKDKEGRDVIEYRLK